MGQNHHETSTAMNTSVNDTPVNQKMIMHNSVKDCSCPLGDLVASYKEWLQQPDCAIHSPHMRTYCMQQAHAMIHPPLASSLKLLL